jgi:hypothetical protein
MYRARQFFRALGSRMGPSAQAEVEALLAPAQVALFQQMPRYDQRHSLDVVRTLRAAGCDQPDLLVAALLHDVAKSAGPLRLWHRVTRVLLEAFAPRWLPWLAREAEPGHWRYPFYIHHVHAEIGARWAEEVGCTSLTVWLIAHHQSSAEWEEGEITDIRERLLASLWWADGQN